MRHFAVDTWSIVSMSIAERHDSSSLDATALGADIALGATTALAAMQQAVDRVAARNPSINAACGVQAEAGLRLAEAMDAELASLTSEQRQALLRDRPFLGVPTLLKDLATAAIGLPSMMGSVLYGKVQWNLDADIVKRYRRAGLIPFGRTTSAELGLSPTTESPVYGPATQNPWKKGHSAGGSSGGAGAALASGMVRIAHGSDGGGSIRIPASCCGVLGLKPSRGLMPLGPLKGEGWGGLATEHMMTLSVRDCAAALDISAGADVGAPYAAPVQPAQSYRGVVARVAADPRAAPRRRIAFINTTYEGGAIHPDVAATLDEAAAFFAALGHELVPAAPPVGSEEVLSPMLPLIASAAANAIDSFVAARGRRLAADELQPTTLGAREYARAISGAQYVACVDTCHEITRRIGRFLHRDGAQGYDLFLSPVLALPPAPIGRYAMDNADYLAYRLGKKGVIGYSPFAPLANLTGMPAISIPFGMSADGLPIGIQVMGPLGAEAQLLELAAQVETLRPWPLTAPMAR
ncbi:MULTISPECIES: amidase [Achromobacter]|uniref:amidase n=1 Tax=Achromobacter TaxID=222 RepID=UPI00244785C3|nr:amidase [Achromobacter mucicolens]MDH1524373.1 amidase [Achromobacter mucicolens]